MIVSEIKVAHVAEYLRLDDYCAGDLQHILNAAKAFVGSYTGLTPEQIDTHEDFYIVIMVLCQDMYDNRCLYVDKNNLNKVVDSILGMYCVNLL